MLLKEHTGRVFRLQFDDFQIVSSSHDDTIIIWDFLSEQAIKSDDQTTTNSSLQRSSSTTNGSSQQFQPVVNNTNNNRVDADRSPNNSPPTLNNQIPRNQRQNQNSPPSPMEGDD